MLIASAIGIWIALSVPFGLVVGAAMGVGMKGESNNVGL